MLKKLKRLLRKLSRRAAELLPRAWRYALFRNMVRLDVAPTDKLVLKVAETQEELEACFRLLHDAYVSAGFMKPDPSGLRVTLYHALPTTTTLMASLDGEVVGTLSLIRESALGFPMQKIFQIKSLRQSGGRIAEVSALAVARRFQATGGVVLFPLMKFLYEYATKLFDTRHLVIAVNPRHIALYESLLFFRRLRQNPVEHYDFVNGAPAVGAHLDLKGIPGVLRRFYGQRPAERNLHYFFTELQLPNIVFPHKRFHTTNDPVMTPELIDYFFNQRTQVFASLSDSEVQRLHAIYDIPAYQAVLPGLASGDSVTRDSRHRRFYVRCPAVFTLVSGPREQEFKLEVVQCSRNSLRARTDKLLPEDGAGRIRIEVGQGNYSQVAVRLLRPSASDSHVFIFRVESGDLAWRKFVGALHNASTREELETATRFMD